MVVTVLISLLFLSLSCAQISINGFDGRNYTIQGQRYGINCSVAASLDTTISMLKEFDIVCSVVMKTCPFLPSESFPCGCSIHASGERILYLVRDNATVEAFHDIWICKQLNSLKYAASMVITVYSGPDNIRLNSTSKVTIAGDGSIQSVQCSADCNPQCSFFWHNGSSDTAPLVFRNRILPSDFLQEQIPGNQVYTCVAINRMKPVNNKQTILLEVSDEPFTKPVAVAPRTSKWQVSNMNNTSISRAPLTNTTRLAWVTGITAKTIAIDPGAVNVSLTPPVTTQRPTMMQQTTITTASTSTTTVTTTLLTSTTAETVSESGSDTETLNTLVVVGVILGVVIGLILIIVVVIVVVVVIYKRGQQHARISRTMTNAPGNPIYVNNPGTMGVNPTFQGTLLVRNDEYMNSSMGGVDQYGIGSATYVNTTQSTLYSSLEKQQLREQPSNTYEQLGNSPTVDSQPYAQLVNPHKHASSEAAQNNLDVPGSPVYMNTGSGSLLGINETVDSTQTDPIDVLEEPVSSEYMNLYVSKS